MKILSFILTYWNEICAVALIAVILVHCVRNGVNCNLDEYPKHRR